MKVRVEKAVWQSIRQFYAESMRKYPSLSRTMVLHKIERLKAALEELRVCALSINSAPYKDSWTQLGYKTYYKEGFVFGYKIFIEEEDGFVVIVHDAVHEKLNYNPEDK